MEYLIAIVLGTVGSLLACEFYGWMPRIACSITRHAASRLPPPEAQRYAEEWLSLLEETPGHCWRLIHAIGFHWAATQICADLRVLQEVDANNKTALQRAGFACVVSFISWIRRSKFLSRTITEIFMLEYFVLRSIGLTKNLDARTFRSYLEGLMHDDDAFDQFRNRVMGTQSKTRD